MANLTDFSMSPAQVQQFHAGVLKASGFQQAAKFKSLSGNGEEYPLLGEIKGSWVGKGNVKPTSSPAVTTYKISPYNLVVLVPVHNQDLQDYDNLLEQIITNGVNGMAKTFDETVYGLQAAPGENFFTLADADTVSITDRVSFYSALAAAGGKVDTLVITNSEFIALAGATTADGNPAFQISNGAINGIPYFISPVDGAIGAAGAFASTAEWGTVSSVNVKVLDQATVIVDDAPLHLGATNMSAIRIEARYGFGTSNPDAFVKFGESSAS